MVGRNYCTDKGIAGRVSISRTNKNVPKVFCEPLRESCTIRKMVAKDDFANKIALRSRYASQVADINFLGIDVKLFSNYVPQHEGRREERRPDCGTLDASDYRVKTETNGAGIRPNPYNVCCV